RDDDVVEHELYAELLIAEPDTEAELFQDAQKKRAVGDDRLELVAQTHIRQLGGTLEREQALPRFHAHPQYAAAQSQRLVRSIEQASLPKATASYWLGACVDAAVSCHVVV